MMESEKLYWKCSEGHVFPEHKAVIDRNATERCPECNEALGGSPQTIVQATMTRDDFMEFFRDTDKLNTLSADDRLEIFESVLVGSSDVTKENVDAVIRNYSVGNLKVIDTSDKLEVKTPDGPRWINLQDVMFHQRFYGLLSGGYSPQEAKRIVEEETAEKEK